MRRLAAGLLLVVAGLLGVSAAAHAQTTLVSNTGQSNDDFETIGFDDYAQAFGTGSHTAGYDLDSIVLSLGSAPTGTGTLTVTVREDASGDPSGTALYTLTTPDPIAGDALNALPPLRVPRWTPTRPIGWWRATAPIATGRIGFERC